MIELFLLQTWILVCLLEGKRDAFFYHNRKYSIKPDNKNIHWLFSVQRFIILSLIFCMYYILNSALSTGVFIFSLILIFSWIHNGVYYFTRHKLDNSVYPKGWFDTSTTSEAKLEFNFISRTFMFITGIIGIVASYTIK